MNYRELVKTKLNRIPWSSVLVTGLIAVVFLALTVYHLVGAALTDALVMAMIAAVFAVLTAKQLPGQKFRQYCQSVDKLGDADAVFAHVDAMVPCAAASGTDLRFDKTYIAYAGETEASIRLAGDLVWGHLHQATAQRHWLVFPVGTYEQHGAMLRFVDGSAVCVELPDSETALAVLEQLKQQYPYMMLGYNAQLEAIYRKDPRELWSAAGYQNVRE